MARPKKEFDLARERRFTLRLREIEYERLCSLADNANMTPSAFLRSLLLNGKVNIHYNIVADIEEIQKLTMQFSRIGNNLNQIVVFYNTGGIQSRAMHSEINRCITELHQMREEVIALGGTYGSSKTHRNKKC